MTETIHATRCQYTIRTPKRSLPPIKQLQQRNQIYHRHRRVQNLSCGQSIHGHIASDQEMSQNQELIPEI